MIITADIQGPLRWVDEPSVYSDALGRKSGIYLWTVEVGDRHLVHYVGQTSVSFSERMKQHFTEYLAGMYFVFDPDALRSGSLQEIWKGMAKRGEEVRCREFMDAHATVQAAIRETISMLKLWLIPLDLPPRQVSRIEGEIARFLYAHRDGPGRLIEPGVSYQRRDANEEPIEVTLAFDERVIALPRSVVA